MHLTPKGQGLQEVIRVQARDAERQIAAIVGDRRFTQLKRTLTLLVDDITAASTGPGVAVS